ncbi:ThiF family adenylyltransferase [Cellulosimicrobium protaetiae]|uniref:Thiamine biosynthesis protein ThiF n=1 Tax=Cellulosimicrobium protaetiae TaxID=2587808 RepID=A0A6M5UJG5_9MICO|nr:ThiF family adenylyltransferase [Cellulosimicrobium protaetiae]QJW37433.1 thiamine biosynthesis protein ThiF [Cellulosimicrobium protaetiae]
MPRRRVLRPEARVLRRAPGEVQVGTDPRWSVRIAGLEPDDEEWLGALASPAGQRGGPDPVLAGATGASGRRSALVTLLEEAHLLVPARPRRAASTAPANGHADLGVLSALRPDGAGHRVLAARARSTVAVVGLGRVGAALALHLATAGVGTIVVDDPGTVLSTDVGSGAYRVRDVGASREAAVRRLVEEVAPAVVVAGTSSERTTAHVPAPPPDVVVVVEHGAADPGRVRRLVGEGVAHLSVVVREADVVVGPFVRPGLDPCLTCVDLRQADVDPCWPQLARQLRERRPAGSCEETLVAASAAAVALGQVLAALDGLVPRAATACIEIPAPDAVPRLRETSRHPLCGCGELARTPPDGAPLPMSGRRRGAD